MMSFAENAAAAVVTAIMAIVIGSASKPGFAAGAAAAAAVATEALDCWRREHWHPSAAKRRGTGDEC